MRTINIHEAKTHLSRLVETAVTGEPFVIAKAGKPMVLVSAYVAAPAAAPQRIGFMGDSLNVPDDFDSLAQDHIAALFSGDNGL